MLEVVEVKHEKKVRDNIYTIVLNNGESYRWDVYFIEHCGLMFRALFDVDGVKLPRVMENTIGDMKTYTWWDDLGEPMVRELSEGEKLAYCKLKEIFYDQQN